MSIGSDFLFMLSACVIWQTNRTEMTSEAKRAAKLEKKLKILLGGYQVVDNCILLVEVNGCCCLVDDGTVIAGSPLKL